MRDTLQAYDLSTRSWTVRAPVPKPLCGSVRVQLAGRIYVVCGCTVDDDAVASVFSYDPRTDQWRSESPLPLADYEAYSDTLILTAVAHEGRVIVIGIGRAPF